MPEHKLPSVFLRVLSPPFSPNLRLAGNYAVSELY